MSTRLHTTAQTQLFPTKFESTAFIAAKLQQLGDFVGWLLYGPFKDSFIRLHANGQLPGVSYFTTLQTAAYQAQSDVLAAVITPQTACLYHTLIWTRIASRRELISYDEALAVYTQWADSGSPVVTANAVGLALQQATDLRDWFTFLSTTGSGGFGVLFPQGLPNRVDLQEMISTLNTIIAGLSAPTPTISGANGQFFVDLYWTWGMFQGLPEDHQRELFNRWLAIGKPAPIV